MNIFKIKRNILQNIKIDLDQMHINRKRGGPMCLPEKEADRYAGLPLQF